jgi:hypothetical protein
MSAFGIPPRVRVEVSIRASEAVAVILVADALGHYYLQSFFLGMFP